MSRKRRRKGEPVTPMSEEARALAAANMGLAYKFAAKAKEDFYGLDEEIDSAAMLGLCKAARAFDPSRGIRFSTLAYTCMKHEVRAAWRDYSRYRQRSSVPFSAFGADSDFRVDFPDTRTAPDWEALDREVAAVEVRAGLATLPPRERFVLELLVFRGMTGKEAGIELGRAEGKPGPISDSRIGQIADRAKARLARRLERHRRE